MLLARNKQGQVGRKLRSFGETAQVAVAPKADEHHNVEVNYSNIDKNQKYWEEREAKFKRDLEIKNAKIREEKARKQKAQKEFENQILAEQKLIPINPLEDALKKKFAREAVSPQSDRVVASLKADFYDREMIPVPQEGSKYGVVSPDFAIFKEKGNPLTRDGRYGVVTDFDKIVAGTELDAADVKIVGGTMVRRLPQTRRATDQMGAEDVMMAFDTTASTSSDDKVNLKTIGIASVVLAGLFFMMKD